jgi:hypothetical protein
LNNKLKARFLSYNENTIPKLKNVPQLKVMVEDPNFSEEVMKKTSPAALAFSLWVRAVVKVYNALLIVEPKRIELAAAKAKAAAAQKELEEKKATL